MIFLFTTWCKSNLTINQDKINDPCDFEKAILLVGLRDALFRVTWQCIENKTTCTLCVLRIDFSDLVFAEEPFQRNGEQIIEDRDDTTEEKTHKVRIGVTEVICFADSATGAGAAEINRA